MDTFFSDCLYRIISWFIGDELDLYLAGFDDATSTFYNSYQVSYPELGIISIVVAILFVIAYYLYDSPSLNQTRHWSLWGIICGVLNLIIGCSLCYNAVLTGDAARYGFNVEFSNCLMFGVGNLVIAFIFYFVFSLIGKRFSVNCRRTPF